MRFTDILCKVMLGSINKYHFPISTICAKASKTTRINTQWMRSAPLLWKHLTITWLIGCCAKAQKLDVWFDTSPVWIGYHRANETVRDEWDARRCWYPFLSICGRLRLAETSTHVLQSFFFNLKLFNLDYDFSIEKEEQFFIRSAVLFRKCGFS